VADEHVDAGCRTVPRRVDVRLGRQRRVPVLGGEGHRPDEAVRRCDPLDGGLTGDHLLHGHVRGEPARGPGHGLAHAPPSARDAERRALHDGPAEQPRGLGDGQEVRDRVASRGLPERRHALRIAAERADVAGHPPERLQLVEEAEVRRPVAAVAEVAEEPEPVGDRDDDDALLGDEGRRIHDRHVPRPRHVRAAVDPHHHGQPGVRLDVARHRDGHAQAVLVHAETGEVAEHVVELRHGRLGARGRPLERVARLLPVGMRDGRREAGSGGVRDPGGPDDPAVGPADHGAAGRREGAHPVEATVRAAFAGTPVDGSGAGATVTPCPA
jgi:hypothetical protein